MNYLEAAKLLGASYSKELSGHARLIRDKDNTIGIRLYDTTILTYYPNGNIQIFMGGYETVTTIKTINRYLTQGSIQNIKGRRCVCTQEGIYLFKDNMTLFPDGSCDSKHIAVYEFEGAGEKVNTIEDVRQLIKGSTLDALKKLWRKCPYSRTVIAYYASLNFIPLILNTAKVEEPWLNVAKYRLAEG